MKELGFIYKRHSVRRYQDTPVPAEDLRQILAAATQAPSGKNLQNWHFVVVKNAALIANMAAAVREKNRQLAEYLPEEERKPFTAMVEYHTVFRQAPVVILAYAGPYPTVAESLLKGGRMPEQEARKYAKANPAIQNVAAAMENLTLAAAALGYGTCWMTGPTYAAEEIGALIGPVKDSYFLAAMTPLGIPLTAGGSSPQRKPLEEVVTIIE
ncbi:nitroreductase family protein [Propionispora hippei]|uniref:Nitroreductase n=1 Tax=Propionispora hippei DSM 15287 TaxID=1123003 RepID=A0A1M6MPJ8_9FIRM|nr:nitroreductase family protein [Propionispora hippei]SHJ85213.1 Nitroreductase [Propionispora hippei DSM 15287]